MPDYEWTFNHNLWNDSDAATDALWAAVVDNITLVYPVVKEMGFEGIVYDNEGYYSGVMVLPDGKTRASRLWDQQDQVRERAKCARRERVGGARERGRESARGSERARGSARERERRRDEDTDRERETHGVRQRDVESWLLAKCTQGR